MYQNNDRLDWHEELRRARNMEDDFGFLTFGRAWDAVRMLAQANDPIEQEKRIDSLWRMYPEAAEKLGLPKLPVSQVKPAASSSVESRADPGTNPPKRQRVKLPAPVRTVNTSGSMGLGSHELKPTQRPLNPPTYFPEDLWASTCVILDEAIGKFPNREQLPELCRRYISKMTPVYSEAVKSGKMKAGWVLQERLGGMLDLLHSLLAHNDDGPSSGGLSNKTYGTYEEARNSKEFRKLEKAIADMQPEMQHNSTGADRLRTGEQQASLAPNENLYNAILTKKARIAEIERTLNRPLAAEHRGRAVHGGESWRQRLEEERQHLLIAVPELEAELKHCTVSPAQNKDKTTQSVESKPAVRSRNLGGRPRKDTERQLIREKKDAGKSWKEIANEVNQETGQQKTTDAYRSLLRSHSGNTKPPGKNVQN